MDNDDFNPYDNDSLFPRKPRGGSGKLRALLRGLDENHAKEMETNELFLEGFDAGYQKALEDMIGQKQNTKELIRMLIKLYDDDNDFTA